MAGGVSKIACLGGGPGGLYAAISLKLRDPERDITVFEPNKPNDTFGWGVVLSNETLDNLAANDAKSAEMIVENFAYWDDVAVVYGGKRMVSSGHGFCGIGRMKLLLLLQERARELGIKLEFETEVEDLERYMRDYDLVIASDGLNSQARSQFADEFSPNIEVRKCHFVWLGTKQKFDDAFTFIFEQTEHGWVWAHAYQFDDETATFIIECGPETYEKFGFANMDQDESIAACEQIFAAHLGGHSLMSNARHIRGSAWLQFPRVLCEKWSYKNLVLLGDAAATAHFSIGSGSKLAVESAIALADDIDNQPSLAAAFEKYEDARRLEVLRLQSAARNSLEWFEDIERYLDYDPVQFNYALMTRSQRISHENLRMRDPKFVTEAENWLQKKAGAPANQQNRPPMFAPYQLREMSLQNRIVMAPMAQYKAENGTVNDWHLSHYGERAKGGVGLVMVEMTAPSATGRITTGCPGLYTDEHVAAWRRVTDFIHQESAAKVCCQLGHSGPKGSTQLGWQKMDAPMESGNWPLLAASEVAWSADNQTPKAMDRTDMDEVADQFVAAAKRAEQAGFDMLELHYAHGYLMSSFITPLTNKRVDDYGGSLANRMRYPLEVLAKVRAVWPQDKPLSVRISATDWRGEEGIEPQHAVEIAQLLKAGGADIINVSAGQTSREAMPVYGRMFQTPFSDRVRNEAHVPTITAGNIYEADHANSIIMAGRADLVAIGRPLLANPYWALHAAAALQDGQQPWALSYQAGRDQLYRLAERDDTMAIKV